MCMTKYTQLLKRGVKMENSWLIIADAKGKSFEGLPTYTFSKEKVVWLSKLFAKTASKKEGIVITIE